MGEGWGSSIAADGHTFGNEFCQCLHDRIKALNPLTDYLGCDVFGFQ
jgi:hypothetical protein